MFVHLLGYTVLEPRESVRKAIVKNLGGELTGVQLFKLHNFEFKPRLGLSMSLVLERNRHAGSGESDRRQRLQPSIKGWWRKRLIERKGFQQEKGRGMMKFCIFWSITGQTE